MAFKAHDLVDPAVFVELQNQLEDDRKSREEIRDIVQDLEKIEKVTLSKLSNAHSAPGGDLAAVANEVQNTTMQSVVEQVQMLAQATDRHPYYKFNGMWARQMQDATLAVLLCGWLGGFNINREGQLLTLEEVGNIFKVSVNMKDVDTFHLTIEEYLHALISLIDELARLARNSVTLGNYERPLLISKFIKDLHAGFQILNLKNDSLRKRTDSIKYKVREVEDVVYDLSLRNLIPKT